MKFSNLHYSDINCSLEVPNVLYLCMNYKYRTVRGTFSLKSNTAAETSLTVRLGFIKTALIFYLTSPVRLSLRPLQGNFLLF